MNQSFLPQPLERNLAREYRVRVSIVFLFFLSLAGLIGVAALFPAYISAISQENVYRGHSAAYQNTADAHALSVNQQALSASRDLILSLKDISAGMPFYSAIQSVISLRGPILITSLSLEHPSPTLMNIVLSGTSPTRTDLLAFRDRLQTLPLSGSVDLPLSVLARDKNISFSLQIHEILP